MPERRRPSTVREVVSWLADGIHAGVWPPEAKLPPERTMASELGVNRSTVATAYSELQALGLVDRRQGSGTFVHGDFWGISPDWSRYLDSAAFRPTQALVHRFREARRLSGIVDFTQADLGPGLWPRERIQEALRGVDVGATLDYMPAAGLPGLREAIASEMGRSQGIEVRPESILITTGAQQALYLIARALLRPGQAIALEEPSFYYSLALFQSTGIRLLPIPMDDRGLLPDALEALVARHRPAMVWLNPTYHNPTTTTLSLERRRAVLALCRRWNLPIIEDDAFGYLPVGGAPAPPPTLQALDGGERVIYIGTLSKVVAPGLRIGWIAAPGPIVERLADVRGQIDLGQPGIVQALAAEMLTGTEWPEYLTSLGAKLRERRDAFMSAMRPLAAQGCSWPVPAGGLYVWLRFPDGMSDRTRLERAIAAGVVYAPGRVYGAPDGYARLNYLWESPARIVEGLNRIAHL